jgi:hypothetical protein
LEAVPEASTADDTAAATTASSTLAAGYNQCTACNEFCAERGLSDRCHIGDNESQPRKPSIGPD